MGKDAITLTEYPGDQVLVVCQPCGREGRYSRARLMQQHSADIGLPDVLARITAECPKRQDWRQYGPCRAGFTELAAKVRNAGGA